MGNGTGTFDSAFVARVLTVGALPRTDPPRGRAAQAQGHRRRPDGGRRAAARASIGDATVLDGVPEGLHHDEIDAPRPRSPCSRSALAKVERGEPAQVLRGTLGPVRERVRRAHPRRHQGAGRQRSRSSWQAAKDKHAKFAEIAKAKSKDPGSGANGGDLGCASPAGYVQRVQGRRAHTERRRDRPPGQDAVRLPHHPRRQPRPRQAVRRSQGAGQAGRSPTTPQAPFNDFLSQGSTTPKVEVNPRYGTCDTSGELGAGRAAEGAARTTTATRRHRASRAASRSGGWAPQTRR